MTLTAGELYRRGRDHLNAGRNARARRDLTLAANRTDDEDLRARIAGSLAAVITRQGEPTLAQQVCHDALVRPGLSAATSGMLQGQLGLLALERGDIDEAITLLDQGIALVGDDRDHRPAMVFNRSVAHMQRVDLPSAAADLALAAADYAAVGDDIQQAMTEHNGGYVALLAGDLVGALAAMGRARTVLESTSAVNVAICELDRAEVLRDAGMTMDAARTLERVAAVFAAHRMRQARGEAEYHRARALLTFAPERAARVAAQAVRTFTVVGSEGWALRADAVRLRALLDAPSGAARQRTPGSAEIDRVALGLVARRLTADAAALRLSGELSSASRATPTGVRAQSIRIPPNAPIQVRLLAHEVRSARAAARGDDTAARRHAGAGLDALAAWQNSFGSLDLATSLILHGKGLVLAGLGAAIRSSRPEVLFEWSERARHLSQRSVPLRPPPDPEMAADLAELRMIRADSGEEWLGQKRAGELHDRLRQRQWTATGSSGRIRDVGLDELTTALGADTAYVTYVFDGTALAALVVTADQSRVAPLSPWPWLASELARLRADLDMSAAMRSGPMAAPVAEALAARLASISGALLDPLLHSIGVRRVVLTIPGILGGVPWSMLPGLVGTVFTIATSASQWVDRPRVRRPERAGFAVGPGVARAGEEVARAGEAWNDAETLRGDRATVAEVTRLASRVDALHVAAHGRHSVEHPLFSGLDLADGTLFGYDIDLIPDVPRLVVMSACEVGRSAVRGGEEAIGMTRIWLYAGTACVVSAPVVVADDDACELLGAVHADLADGLAPAEALVAASARTGIVAPFQAYGAGF